MPFLSHLFYNKNPSSFCDFIKTIPNIDMLFVKYYLLTDLDVKYRFIKNNQICLFFEYQIFRELVPNLPNTNVSSSEYNNYIEYYNNFVSETLKNKRRHEKTISFICDIFERYCTGEDNYTNQYTYNPLALCISFGKNSLNRYMRRLIYDSLDHEVISKATFGSSPLQSAMLKIYCKFMYLSGKTPNSRLVEHLNTLEFVELPNNEKENNRHYNKAVRLFNSICMNPTGQIKPCNNIDLKVDSTNNQPYQLLNGLLCKVHGNSIDYIMSLEEFADETQVKILDNINKNYSSLAIHDYPATNLLIIDINGQNYLKRRWNFTKNNYDVILVDTLEYKS
jgi:hypothetical protein